MAKTPDRSRPASGSKPKTPRAKAAKAKAKPTPAADSVYEENKEAIDTALRQCTAHLKKLEPSVAFATIRLLQRYDMKHGLPVPTLTHRL